MPVMYMCLPQKLCEEIERVAAVETRTKSNAIVRLLEEALEQRGVLHGKK